MDKITLGNRIRELREERKLTQMEFSEMIDISDKALSKIEVGRSYPKLDTFFAMSEMLEISLDNFIRNVSENTNEVYIKKINDRLSNMDLCSLEYILEFLDLYIKYENKKEE